MNWLKRKLQENPAYSRVAPFVVFLALTVAQDYSGVFGKYWIYFGKTLVGIWMIWLVKPYVSELRWAWSWEALVVGIAIFAVWVGLDDHYRHWGSKPTVETAWNPIRAFGEGSILGYFFCGVRILGSSLVVPPIEEAFYRSFLYRYIGHPDFTKIALNYFGWLPFLATSFIFGFAHYQWLVGIICAMAYQWLVIRKGRLGDAMTAHAITNFLLGSWVVWQGAWKFW